MSYKFEKLEVYKSEKRLLELSIQALKMCIDPNTIFEVADEHEITYSCTHLVGHKDLFHNINEDIIITKESYEGSDSIDTYNVYIHDKDADDKWYLLSYLSYNESGSVINISDDIQIDYNLHDNYLSYYNIKLPQDNRHVRLILPFTKDEYFNHSMNIDFEISFETIQMVLDFEAPEGFASHIYNY